MRVVRETAVGERSSWCDGAVNREGSDDGLEVRWLCYLLLLLRAEKR